MHKIRLSELDLLTMLNYLQGTPRKMADVQDRVRLISRAAT